MLYLIIAIFTSTMISVLLRLGETRCDHKLGMLCCNYITCAIIAAIIASGAKTPISEGLGITLGLGVLAGFLFLATFLLLQTNISKNGIVMSTLFMKLGILVPTLLSILCFGERVTLLRGVGLLLALLGIFVFNFEKSVNRVAAPILLILMLLVGGSADGMSKIYEVFGVAAQSTRYLFYTFVVALILCVGLMLSKKQRIGKKELLWGTLLGLPNYFSSSFLLKSLSYVEAVVAYPIFCIGTIAMVSIIGTLVFKEKMTRQRVVGIAVVAVAVALLNIG